MALKDILKKIEEKNKKDIKHIKKEAEEKCKDINKETEALIRELKEKNKREAHSDAKKLKENMFQNARLKMAKETLKTKSEAVGAVFAEALNKLENLPDKEYASWMERTILDVIEPGENEIILPPKFIKRVDAKDLLESINKKLDGKSRIELSKNTQEITGGFILKKPKKEINCSFESLLEEKSNDIKLKISRLLFKNM